MSKKKTQAEFEAQVEALGKGYKVVGKYVRNRVPVEVKCSNPEHGSWLANPGHLLSGGGCPKCGGNYSPTQEEFVARVEGLGKGYKVIGKYVKAGVKVEIKCPKHGSFFITPRDLFSGKGCSKCAGKYSPTQEEFESRISALGKGYKVVGKYVRNSIKVEIKCPKHGSFFMSPINLYSGHGCPECATSGFKPDKPAILYYFKVWIKSGYWIYKIGISNNALKARYNRSADWKKIHPLQIWHYDNGQEAKDKEQEILSRYASKQFTGKSPLKLVGNTEFFTEDILGIDNLE